MKQIHPGRPELLKLQALLAFSLFLISGCHSAFVQATITNQTGQPVRLFEVDYPNASFGGQDLSPNAAFHYRFKILGEGPTKLTWTTNSGQEFSSAGPGLHENQEGGLVIVLHERGATWETSLRLR